jgi:hypothetical protein
MPWLKRWRDWAMHDLWPLYRIGPQPQALHYRYEKAGLLLENQPIPWNAEAVLVEGRVRFDANQNRHKADFVLRLGTDGQRFIPEAMRRDEDDGYHRLLFRLKVPPRTTTVELLWRTRSLAQMTLPVLSEGDFRRQLSLQMPSLHVRLGQRTVACRTYVSTQCDGLVATAVLSSPTSLAPVSDLDLRVEFHSDRGGPAQTLPVQLTSSQLKSRQATITVVPRKPRRLGGWEATWLLGDVPLASQRIKAISKRQFQKSLRLAETRFVLQSVKKEVTLSRLLPDLDGIDRAGPCFLVSSSEPGMAGLCLMQVRAQVPGAVQAPVLHEQEVLITDGPSPFAPGTLDVADLAQISGFELRLKNQVLGVLPLTAAPTALFSSEGGFTPAADFIWSPAADDQLSERLGRLLNDRDGGY